ncbi:NAD(P)H-hydrate dehydratase [Candidatus Galacturonibacter soehngenii]|uniref:Bifunctional NAD(P)H-hydrate repair enzyme n=1 Tax=Candidatus Galacturonatibacter soehngenii TaxID=2307010 RepID=A0A7V7QME2_9FIRM|nr:NAD(P)H-hydrate dehydratase [Candidatus Galacturonibacter soehngenii]KAB1439857.1 NAD(P)H-hydrate dehydratase [Candidatus Galacturonibacter soehngenii]
MEYILTSHEMKQLDLITIEEIGVPSAVLMEKAALGVIKALNNSIPSPERILIVCGTGNNGGDGIAIGRMLTLEGKQVRIVLIGDENQATVETKRQIAIAKKYNVKIYSTFDNSEYNVIIDALFGIGVSREIEGSYKEAIHYINEAKGFKVAVDIPSGISADTGKVMGSAVKADLTVAIAYKKLGHVLYPGASYCNKIIVCDIGVYGADKINAIVSYTKKDLNRLPKRVAYSNKGTYGKALIIAGSVNMAGAAYLAAYAAYKTGCGLVRIVTPQENREILQSLLPEAILSTYQTQNPDLEMIEDAISWADVINIGPGIGKSETAKRILKLVLQKRNCPLVIDADAINLMAMHQELWNETMKDVVMTPHLKEMSGICQTKIAKIKDNLIQTATKLASMHKLVCVLKDTRTIVAGDNQIYINQSGNNGMAKAGSGDILSGIITGLLAQHMEIFEGAALGVYIHGLSGDKAAQKMGQYGILARDIADSISNVI